MIWTLINTPGNDRPQRRIQDYLPTNVYVTISGDFSVPALMMHPAGNGQRPGAVLLPERSDVSANSDAYGRLAAVATLNPDWIGRF